MNTLLVIAVHALITAYFLVLFFWNNLAAWLNILKMASFVLFVPVGMYWMGHIFSNLSSFSPFYIAIYSVWFPIITWYSFFHAAAATFAICSGDRGTPDSRRDVIDDNTEDAIFDDRVLDSSTLCGKTAARRPPLFLSFIEPGIGFAYPGQLEVI